jgi:hypothetical protein
MREIEIAKDLTCASGGDKLETRDKGKRKRKRRDERYSRLWEK